MKFYRVRTAPQMPRKYKWIWLRTPRHETSTRQNPITKYANREDAQAAANKAQVDADRTWGPGRYNYQVV